MVEPRGSCMESRRGEGGGDSDDLSERESERGRGREGPAGECELVMMCTLGAAD